MTPQQKAMLLTVVDNIEYANGMVTKAYEEARENGLDTKLIRKIIAMRRRKPRMRLAEEAKLTEYLGALGPPQLKVIK